MSKITIYERHKLVVDNVKIHGFYIMRNEDGKIMDEYNNILEAEEKEKNLQKTEQLKLIVKDLKKNDAEIEGYKIFIPNTIDDIYRQATKLNQCLITASYDEKMINHQSILVFIQKDDMPIATCEIDYDKHIKQFYANESDRTNCLPSNNIVEIFHRWLDKAKIKKRKVELNNAQLI